MYNIILALILTCSLGSIVYLLSHKRKMVKAKSDLETEKIVSENDKNVSLQPKATDLLSNLKVKREVLENITEKGLRRLRVFVLRVDNQLVDSIGKLKEDKVSPYVDNGRITALINARETITGENNQTTTITTVTEELAQPANQSDTDIWSLEQSYLKNLEGRFDIDTLTKLMSLYSDIGDFSTMRGTLLRAINNDLSWDEIINDPRLVDNFKKLTEEDSAAPKKTRTIKKSISPKIHQRRIKVQVES